MLSDTERKKVVGIWHFIFNFYKNRPMLYVNMRVQVNFLKNQNALTSLYTRKLGILRNISVYHIFYISQPVCQHSYWDQKYFPGHGHLLEKYNIPACMDPSWGGCVHKSSVWLLILVTLIPQHRIINVYPAEIQPFITPCWKNNGTPPPSRRHKKV